MRFQLDPSYRRFGRTVLAGSPRRLFTVTEAGEQQLAQLERGEPIESSRLSAALVDAGAISPLPPRASDTGHDTGHDPGHDTNSARVSLVTPTIRGVDHHLGSLPGVVDHLIVDDGAEPPIANATIRLEPNRGPAAARNAALPKVTTDLVVFVDDDVLHLDSPEGVGWWDGLMWHFDDPLVAAVAPRVRGRTGTSMLERYEHAHGALDMGSSPGPVTPGSRLSYVPTAALIVRMDPLTQVGGFDEALRTGEDVDLIWRLVRAGWRVRYDPAVIVEHRARTSWRGWVQQRRGYGESAAEIDRRHPGLVAPAVVSPSSVLAMVLATIGHPLVAAGVVVTTSAALAHKLRSLPRTVGFGIGVQGHAAAARGVLRATRRAWWPLAAVAAIPSRSVRRLLLAALLEGITSRIIDHEEHGERRDSIPLALIGLIDDGAYALGVWKGALSRRHSGPLLPRVMLGERARGWLSSGWLSRAWRAVAAR